MPPHIFIGLYKTEQHRPQLGIWHWAIVVQPTDETPLYSKLDCWSVGEDDYGIWKSNHRLKANGRGVSLLDSGRFFALVRLPDITASIKQLDELLSDQDAEQGNTALVVGRGQWSCAQWVIRALQEILAKGWFTTEPVGNLSDSTAYYDFIRRSKGAMCELALANNLTGAEYVGTVVDGIRVL